MRLRLTIEADGEISVFSSDDDARSRLFAAIIGYTLPLFGGDSVGV